MRIRSHRRNLVVWSSSAASASRPGDRGHARLARGRRIWWLRTGALLTVIGVVRLAQLTRARRRDALLVTGTLLTVIGITLGSMATFCCGVLIWAIARPWHWDEQTSR
jgi:hypothetical protein